MNAQSQPHSGPRSLAGQEKHKPRSDMGKARVIGWRKPTKVTGKSPFLKKKPAVPYTESCLGPQNVQGGWHRGQCEDF